MFHSNRKSGTELESLKYFLIPRSTPNLLEHSELVEDFSSEEWNVALASLKNGKAAGLDGVKNEALKYSGDNF